MTLYAKKDYSSNLLKFSKEENYIVNVRNNIVYSAIEKGVSIEYVIDKFLPKDSTGIFIYENLESNEISIIFINSVKKSIVFYIKSEKDFSNKRLENFIKLICFQENICSVYFFENSKVVNNILLPNYVDKNFINRADFKKAIKRSSKLRNNQNKILSLLLFMVLAVGLSYSLDKMFIYLTNKSNLSYDVNYKALIDEKFSLEDELLKYENLTQNLKEIRVVSNYSEYKKIKEEEALSNKALVPQNNAPIVQGEFR